MNNEQRYHLHRLAEDLVTPERFSAPPIAESVNLDLEWDADIAEEKARILVERAYRQPVDYGE